MSGCLGCSLDPHPPPWFNLCFCLRGTKAAPLTEAVWAILFVLQCRRHFHEELYRWLFICVRALWTINRADPWPPGHKVIFIVSADRITRTVLDLVYASHFVLNYTKTKRNITQTGWRWPQTLGSLEQSPSGFIIHIFTLLSINTFSLRHCTVPVKKKHLNLTMGWDGSEF